jgi:hypothetical protein
VNDSGQSQESSLGDGTGDAICSTPKPLHDSEKEVADQDLHACLEDKSKSDVYKVNGSPARVSVLPVAPHNEV